MSEKVFEFRDLFLEVNNNDKNIKSNYVRLLDGISGKFISGEITAVMGASGSGKSTLFDMLLGRVSSDSKSYGTILYNNQERNAYDWIRKVAYLRQDDIYFEKFTILESIMFDLDFYQPFKSNKEKLNFAEILLKRSSIYEKRNAYISSLSGGERKRAMIARSMCSDPEIIFMDEPTSGLDSHSALTLINFLKDFAKEHNKLVIISVHQPGEALFNLFDKILYLENGSVFYNGKIKDIPEWLFKNNLVKPEGMSLAEFLFELLSDNPHLPEIRRFHPMVNEIIASNKQKYDHIRRNCALESNISTSYFEMSFSIIDIITFIRRFYLDLFRTGNIFSIFLKDGFYIGFLTVNCILFSCLIDKLLLDKLNPEENDFNDLIEGAKVYYTSDMKKYTSFFLFHLFSHFGTLISFFIRNICNKRSQILEDIYSAKYSVLTCFVGYFIHDFTLTLFSFGFGACTIVWCGLGPLINYWYLIFFFSMVFCYAINFIFLKCVIGFSCYSNYFSIILFLFNFFIGKEMGLMSPEFKLTGVLKVFTYPKYLSFFFPQLLLNAIFNYMNTEIVKMNTSGSGLKENRDFIPFISSKEFEGIEPKDAFSIIGLSSCPFRAFILVFVLSLLINIFGSLYFFNRHIGAMLRLKMNKQ